MWIVDSVLNSKEWNSKYVGNRKCTIVINSKMIWGEDIQDIAGCMTNTCTFHFIYSATIKHKACYFKMFIKQALMGM